MRVALVGPELEENLALRYVHAALTAAGHEGEIFDFHAPAQLDAVAASVLAYSPDMVGLSMVFTSRARQFADLAAALRAGGFAGHVTAGGHFASFNAEDLLRDVPALDSVIHGDGEPGMVDLLGHCDRPEMVAGLTFRDGAGRIVSTGGRPNAADLDGLPRPTRPARFQDYFGLPVASMLGSRGCCGDCSFCSINAWHRRNGGRRFRLHGVERVASEIAELYHRRGVRIFNFHDDNFFLPERAANLARFRELKGLLERAAVGRVALQVKARPDAIDPEVMAALMDAGLFRVFLGVETNAVAGLRTLGRGIAAEQNRRALEVLERLGVHTCFNLLMFDPETTFEDLGENLAFMRSHARFPLNFSRVEIYAGTALEDRLRREGRLEGSYWGWTYRIADPRVQEAFEVMRDVFWGRNFRVDGLNHRAMDLDYQFHLLRHFRPHRARRAVERRVKGLIAELNRNSAELLERIADFALSPRAGDAGARAASTARLLRERESFDAAMGPRMLAALRTVRSLAREDTARRRFAVQTAAAAAAGIIAISGCENGDVNTQPFEMAHAPGAPPDTPAEPPPPTAAVRELTPEETKRVIATVQVAYQNRLAELMSPYDFGSLRITLYLELDGTGRVASSDVHVPSPADAAQARAFAEFKRACVTAMRSWRFEGVASPGACLVPLVLFDPSTYPFEMMPFPERD